MSKLEAYKVPSGVPLAEPYLPEPQEYDPLVESARVFLQKNTDVGRQAGMLADADALAMAKQYGWAEYEKPKPQWRGAILPASETPSGGVQFDPSAGVMGSALSALTAPKRAAYGEIPAFEDGRTSPEMMQEALNMTGAMGQGSFIAGPKAGTALGSGPLSKLTSAVDRAAAQFPQGSATGKEWLGWLRKQPGVKGEEVDWRGLEEEIGKAPKLTKEEALEILDKNKVVIEEIVLGDNVSIDPEKVTRSSVSPRYEQYQTPGGNNYREVVLKLPEKGAPDITGWTVQRSKLPLKSADGESYGTYTNIRIVDKDGKVVDSFTDQLGYDDARLISDTVRNIMHESGANYAHPHWPNIQNPLAHVRLNDREIEIPGYGKVKTVFGEEIQSDWHQKGRKEGYSGQEITPQSAKLWLQNRYPTAASKVTDETVVDTAIKYGMTKNNSGETPDAPFKKTWPDLILKRMMQEAVDGGYGAIGWLGGKANAERFDLSSVVSKIKYDADKNRLYGYDLNGDPVLTERNVTPDKLAEYVGAALAERIMKQEGPIKTVEGADLAVGGEGMEAFYDRMLVNIAKDLFGVKPIKVQLPGKAKVTDAMDYIRNNVDEEWLYNQGIIDLEEIGNSAIFGMAEDLGFKPAVSVEAWVLPIDPKIAAKVAKGQNLFVATPPIPAPPQDDMQGFQQ